MSSKRIAKNRPVRISNPTGQNVHYKNQLGIVKESELLIGCVWSHKVRLNSGSEVWFNFSELTELKNT